ncbi:MAG: BatD family protein, partial [Deltaproteobacteria bacterium]|nr:BatD family protein [Deltaproteobacteria bacterium]MBW2537411.1 BatD family protein [Deltaproteobacteria bacterium]
MTALGRAARLLLLWFAVALAVGAAPPSASRAFAQGRPEVSASISNDHVEVGEAFTIELVAMVEGDELPSDPHLYAPAGIDVAGPRVSTRIVSSWGTGMGNAVKRGIGATWQLIARREGTYTIAAPSVVIGGQRISGGRTMKVKVSKDTGRRHGRRGRASPFGRSPFSTPGGTFSFPFNFQFGGSAYDDLFEDDRDVMDDDGSRLRMDREPDRYVFLRAIADKKTAVVGEQVTLTFYVYYRASFEMSDRHEASLADFLRVPMLQSPGSHPPIMTRVGGRRYQARLLDRMAIFPLRAGTLRTGKLTAKFTGSRIGKGVMRESNDVAVEVREPPTEGRPPGYRIGDVGRFRLSASVQPREIEAGDSVAVLVRLEGSGSLPHSLEVPERTGMEWLEPEKRGEVTINDDRVGGWKTFGYVVRIHEPGKRYLGRLSLPYYDPDREQYATAEVDLGEVVVRGAPDAQAAPATTSSAQPGAADEGDGFARIGGPRLSLGAFEPPRDGGIEPRTFL